MKWCVLFAGGGGVDCGLIAAGHEVATAIELEPAIAACYKANHPETQLIVADVRAVESNLAQLPAGIDALWCSPVCKQDSKARNKTLAVREDAAIGRAVIPYIEAIQPELFILENVQGYKNNPAYHEILLCLMKLGYNIDVRVLNAMNYGVPQSRSRLILQARRGPIAWPAYATRRTWYDALHMRFASMERIELASWQKQLWTPQHEALCPCIVYGHYDFRDSKDEAKQLDITTKDQPARTVTSSHNNLQRRIVLADGRILRMTHRESACLQSFPDTYQWPVRMTLAQEIIGNAVPPLLVQSLTEAYATEKEKAVA